MNSRRSQALTIKSFDASVQWMTDWTSSLRNAKLSLSDPLSYADCSQEALFSSWQHGPLTLRAVGMLEPFGDAKGEAKQYVLTELGRRFSAAVDSSAPKQTLRSLYLEGVRTHPGFEIASRAARTFNYANVSQLAEAVRRDGGIPSSHPDIMEQMTRLFIEAWTEHPDDEQKRQAHVARRKLFQEEGVEGLTNNHWKIGRGGDMDDEDLISLATALAETRFHTGTPSQSDERPAALCWASGVVAARIAETSANEFLGDDVVYDGKAVLASKAPFSASVAHEILSDPKSAKNRARKALSGRREDVAPLVDAAFAMILAARRAPFPYGTFSGGRLRFSDGEAKVNGKDADASVALFHRVVSFESRSGTVYEIPSALSMGGSIRATGLWELAGPDGVDFPRVDGDGFLRVVRGEKDGEISCFLLPERKRWPDGDEEFSIGTVSVRLVPSPRIHVAVKVPTSGLGSNSGTLSGGNADELQITTAGSSQGVGVSLASVPVLSFDGKNGGSWHGPSAALGVIEKIASRHAKAGGREYRPAVVLHGEGIREGGVVSHLAKAIPDDKERALLVVTWWIREARKSCEEALERKFQTVDFFVDSKDSWRGVWSKTPLSVPSALSNLLEIERTLVARLPRWEWFDRNFVARMVSPSNEVYAWHSYKKDAERRNGAVGEASIRWKTDKDVRDAEAELKRQLRELSSEALSWNSSSDSSAVRAFTSAAALPSWSAIAVAAKDYGAKEGAAFLGGRSPHQRDDIAALSEISEIVESDPSLLSPSRRRR